MNKEICTNCKKEFNFSDEYDERFEGTKVFKYPRTPRRKFCGHICSIKYHNNNYKYDHYSARIDWNVL